MKTTLIAAAAALTLTFTSTTAQAATTNDVHIVAVDGWASPHAPVDLFGETGWTAQRFTFIPQWSSGAYHLHWDGFYHSSVEFWHSAPWRCDFVVLQFAGGVDVSGVGVYAEAWRPPSWGLWAASLPASGQTWAAYRVYVSGQSISVGLVASGTGTAPQFSSYYEAFVP